MKKYDRLYLAKHRSKPSKEPFFRRKLVLLVAKAVCLVTFVACLYLLSSYFYDYFRSRQGTRQLQNLYYEEPSSQTSPEPLIADAQPIFYTSAPVQAAQPATQPPFALSVNVLAVSDYPTNPYLTVSSAFTKLRRTNPDIIGWLKIDGTLDEAVVQRDNAYYLKRDYMGYHNDNGALFLDENCNLKSRPHIYVVYGHNMKSGAMFGALHHYEKINFYHEHCLISFNTIYEEGNFAVFSVCDLTTKMVSEGLSYYYNFDEEAFQEWIRKLKVYSIYSSVLETNAQDQYLLLITCNGDDTQRRIVAARRVRENETPDQIRKMIQTTKRSNLR